jgi:Zn-finger nucleic acid-binding protein
MRPAPAIRTEGIICPACNSAADPVRSGSIEYDRCRSCGGVWLDRGELEQIIAMAYRTGKQARLSWR